MTNGQLTLNIRKFSTTKQEEHLADKTMWRFYNFNEVYRETVNTIKSCKSSGSRESTTGNCLSVVLEISTACVFGCGRGYTQGRAVCMCVCDLFINPLQYYVMFCLPSSILWRYQGAPSWPVYCITNALLYMVLLPLSDLLIFSLQRHYWWYLLMKQLLRKMH